MDQVVPLGPQEVPDQGLSHPVPRYVGEQGEKVLAPDDRLVLGHLQPVSQDPGDLRTEKKPFVKLWL